MLDAFLKQLQLETSYQMLKHITISLNNSQKEENKKIFCET